MIARLRALARTELGRRLATATVSSGVIWFAGTLATFAVGVVLARGLGPAGYGFYGTALAIVTLLAVPAQLGLPLLATREVPAARVRGQPKDVAALGWWFGLAVAAASLLLATALALAAAALPLTPTLRPALGTAAALLPALALSGLAAGLLRGQERVVTSQALDVLVRPLLFLTALMLCARPLGVPAALGAQIAAGAAIAIIGVGLFQRGLPSPRGGARHLRAWTASALPMTVLEAMRAVDGSYPVLIASYAATIADAGLLRVALAAAVVASLPNSLQAIVMAPFMAGAHAAGERGRLARIVAASTLFATVTVAAATLVIAVAGRWALPFAFGPGFAGAYLPLLLLSLNQLLAAAFGPGVILLSMTGHERAVARAFGASVPAAILAALVLTPRFGVSGAASAAMVATMVRAAILNRVARRALGFSPSLLGALGFLHAGSDDRRGTSRLGRPGDRR